MNWMTSAKNRINRAKRKADNESSLRMSAWNKMPKTSVAPVNNRLNPYNNNSSYDNAHVQGRNITSNSCEPVVSRDVAMLLGPQRRITNKAANAAKENVRPPDLPNMNRKNSGLTMRVGTNVERRNDLIDGLQLSPTNSADRMSRINSNASLKCGSISRVEAEIEEITEELVILYFNDGYQCDERGARLSLFPPSKNNATTTVVTPSSVSSLISKTHVEAQRIEQFTFMDGGGCGSDENHQRNANNEIRSVLNVSSSTMIHRDQFMNSTTQSAVSIHNTPRVTGTTAVAKQCVTKKVDSVDSGWIDDTVTLFGTTYSISQYRDGGSPINSNSNKYNSSEQVSAPERQQRVSTNNLYTNIRAKLQVDTVEPNTHTDTCNSNSCNSNSNNNSNLSDSLSRSSSLDNVDATAASEYADWWPKCQKRINDTLDARLARHILSEMSFATYHDNVPDIKQVLSVLYKALSDSSSKHQQSMRLNRQNDNAPNSNSKSGVTVSNLYDIIRFVELVEHSQTTTPSPVATKLPSVVVDRSSTCTALRIEPTIAKHTAEPTTATISKHTADDNNNRGYHVMSAVEQWAFQHRNNYGLNMSSVNNTPNMVNDRVPTPCAREALNLSSTKNVSHLTSLRSIPAAVVTSNLSNIHVQSNDGLTAASGGGRDLRIGDAKHTTGTPQSVELFRPIQSVVTTVKEVDWTFLDDENAVTDVSTSHHSSNNAAIMYDSQSMRSTAVKSHIVTLQQRNESVCTNNSKLDKLTGGSDKDTRDDWSDCDLQLDDLV